MFCLVHFFLVSFPLIAVSAFLHRSEKGSLTKRLCSIHAVASALFEKDYEKAEKSKEKDCGSDDLKGLRRCGKWRGMKKKRIFGRRREEIQSDYREREKKW